MSEARLDPLGPAQTPLRAHSQSGGRRFDPGVVHSASVRSLVSGLLSKLPPPPCYRSSYRLAQEPPRTTRFEAERRLALPLVFAGVSCFGSDWSGPNVSQGVRGPRPGGRRRGVVPVGARCGPSTPTGLLPAEPRPAPGLSLSFQATLVLLRLSWVAWISSPQRKFLDFY